MISLICTWVIRIPVGLIQLYLVIYSLWRLYTTVSYIAVPSGPFHSIKIIMTTQRHAYFRLEIQSCMWSDLQCVYVDPHCRYNLAAGTSEKIQLAALLGAFQIVRDTVVSQAEHWHHYLRSISLYRYSSLGQACVCDNTNCMKWTVEECSIVVQL